MYRHQNITIYIYLFFLRPTAYHRKIIYLELPIFLGVTVCSPFSRFAIVRSMHTKQPSEVVKCMDIFRKCSRKPYLIQTDAGKELTGNVMKYFLKGQNIDFRIRKMTLPAKCVVIERFNRTLKQRIQRYLN